MNKKVSSLESQMDARVNEAVQLVLSQQRAIAGSQPDVVISLASQRHRSCASTAAPDIPSDYDWTLIKAHQQRNKKCGKTIPLLGTQQ